MPYSNSTLTTLHNIALPSNHLLTFQLVRQESAPSPRVNLKPEHFYFVTLAPGEGGAASRTYNFANKINIKFSTAEIFALAFTLQQCAGGNSRSVLPYSKFSKSSTGQKVLSVIEGEKSGKNGPERKITIFVNCNGNNNAITIPPCDAYSLAKQLDLSAIEAVKLEFTRISSAVSVDTRPKNQTPQGNFSMPLAPSNNQQPTPFPQNSKNQTTPFDQAPTSQPANMQNGTPPIKSQNLSQSSDDIADKFAAMMGGQG